MPKLNPKPSLEQDTIKKLKAIMTIRDSDVPMIVTILKEYRHGVEQEIIGSVLT
jgi:hypothetical protein